MITPLGERLVKLAKNLLEFHADALKVIDDLVRRLEAV